jgi:hypothetical protein
VEKKCIKIYVNVCDDEQKTIFSGITFHDFIECVPIPIENILLLKSDYIGEKSCHRFELLEGRDDISKFLREGMNNYGDLCFVDYADTALVGKLAQEQVAELLYLAHMFKPLKPPFYDVLQNRLAYLSHDDGWHCNLYCKDSQIPIFILLNKLKKSIQSYLRNNECVLPNNLTEIIRKLSMKGLLIELDFSSRKRSTCTIRIFEVGKYENMDNLFNDIGHHIPPALIETEITNLGQAETMQDHINNTCGRD